MMKNKTEKIVLVGGCFWCLEAVFQNIKEIIKVTPGYAGGKTKNPTYDKVCAGKTGHVEVVLIEYNPEKINLQEILRIFFNIYNPTTLNGQGNDSGTQYRSIILFKNKNQKNLINQYIDKIRDNYKNSIVTGIKKLDNFYQAEEYHQNYFKKNAQNTYCQAVIRPKLEKYKT